MSTAPNAPSTAWLQCGHGLRTVENWDLPPLRSRSWWSFNAATVFGPWRTMAEKDSTLTPGGLQCGHGLRTVENHRATLTGLLRTRASMRPRSSDRGELSGAAAGSCRSMLQCGHGLRTVENDLCVMGHSRHVASFNAATVFGPWRTTLLPLPLASPVGLQCGHGLRTVENHVPRVNLRPHDPASMRPRSSDRGEPDRRRPV